MTDTTKKLMAIIQKQQEIIEKMAQQMQLKPQHLSPAQPELHADKLVYDSLSPAVKNALRPVMPIVQHGTTLKAFFKPGQASQAALNHIIQVVQSLLKQNKLPFPYTVEAVDQG